LRVLQKVARIFRHLPELARQMNRVVLGVKTHRGWYLYGLRWRVQLSHICCISERADQTRSPNDALLFITAGPYA